MSRGKVQGTVGISNCGFDVQIDDSDSQNDYSGEAPSITVLRIDYSDNGKYDYGDERLRRIDYGDRTNSDGYQRMQADGIAALRSQ